jgi:hypothetical protein
LPRSGTTWVATILAQTENAVLVREPDNHLSIPFALRAKRPLPGGYYTALSAAQEAPVYESLWRQAFGECGSSHTRVERIRRRLAGRLFESAGEEAISMFFRSGGFATRLRAAEVLAVPERPERQSDAVIVKSVYSALAVEWIAARFEAQVLIVLRDLLNLVSSWVALDWLGPPGVDELAGSDPALQRTLGRLHGVPPLPADGSPVARLAWFLALLTLSLEATAQAHPEWHVVLHEDLCARPADHFRALAARLGLSWSAATEAVLAATDRPGSGFAIERVASSLPDAWRSRLTRGQVAEIAAVLAPFPLRSTDKDRLLTAGTSRFSGRGPRARSL